jgi:hypothetical protein
LKDKAALGEEDAVAWVDRFKALAAKLKVCVEE